MSFVIERIHTYSNLRQSWKLTKKKKEVNEADINVWLKNISMEFFGNQNWMLVNKVRYVDSGVLDWAMYFELI